MPDYEIDNDKQQVAVRIYHKLVREDISPACKVKIAMVCEIEYGVLVTAGGVAYDESVIVGELILHAHRDISRETVAPVRVS